MKFLSIFLFCFALLSAPSVYAQGLLTQQELTGTTTDEGMITSVVLADVSLQDVLVENIDGVYKGSFTLTNQMGLQNNISYGVVLRNKVGKLISIHKLGELSSLLEKESRLISFEYKTPEFLPEETTIYLVAQTSEGLPLSTQKVAVVDGSTQKPPFQCSVTGAKLSCSNELNKNDKFDVAVYSSLFSSSALWKGSLSSENELDLSDKVVGPVIVEVSSGTFSEYFQLSLPGTYARILNVSIEQEEVGLLSMVTSFMARPIKGVDVEYKLADDQSNSCASGKLETDGFFAQSKVQTNCVSGQYEISLKNSEGIILSTQAGKFNVSEFVSNVESEMAPEEPVSSLTSKFIILIPLLIILILVIMLLIWKSKKINTNTTIALSFVILVFFGFSKPASAVTIGVSSMFSGEISHIVLSTITNDKSSYTPGEAITFTASTNVSHDAYGDGQYLSYSIGINWNGVAGIEYDAPFIPATETAPAFAFINTPYSIPFTYVDSYTNVAPMTTGNHYIALRGVLQSRLCQTCSDYDNGAVIRNQPISVVPAGPTYTINASVNNAPYGSISPSGAVIVASGGSQAFTTSLAVPTRHLAWYHIDGNSFAAPTNPYTFNNVLGNRSIQAVLWPYKNLGGISTPTNVTATPQACGAIVVSWDTVAAATAGYMVFEGTPSDPIMMGASGPYMTNTYTRTAGLVPGDSYCFSVEASNTYDSVPSVPVCATAPADCVASFPVAGSCGDSGVPLGLNCMAGETTFLDCAPTERSYFKSSPSSRSCPMNVWNDTQAWGICVADPTCVSSACTVQDSIGGTIHTYNEGETDFDDFWTSFRDSNTQFTGSGFAGVLRYRACEAGGTNCGSPFGVWSAAPATRRPTIPATCASFAPTCSNGLDDDGDGSVDTNDSQCHSDNNPANPGSYTPTVDTEGSAPAPTVNLNFTN